MKNASIKLPWSTKQQVTSIHWNNVTINLVMIGIANGEGDQSTAFVGAMLAYTEQGDGHLVKKVSSQHPLQSRSRCCLNQ